MFGFLCTQPAYDYGDKTPAPSAPTTPSLFDGLGLAALWQAPAPAYVDQPPGAAAASSPGFLCWLFGSPTLAYQTATPSAPTSQTARQQPPRTPGR